MVDTFIDHRGRHRAASHGHPLPVTIEGGATTAFGEVAVAESTPQVQIKFPNGIVPDNCQVLTNKAGSSAAATNGLCTVTVAGVAEAFSQIRSRDVIRYGQDAISGRR